MTSALRRMICFCSISAHLTHLAVCLVQSLTISIIQLVFLFEWHMTDGSIFVLQGLDSLLSAFFVIFCQSLNLCYHFLLLLQVFLLLRASTSSCSITSLKEFITGSKEIVPQLITNLSWHHTDCLPLLLQLHHLVGCRLPFCRVLQSLCSLYQFLLLGDVLLEAFLELCKELILSREESVTSSTEAFKNLYIHRLWSEANLLPFCLNINNFLTLCFPVAAVLQFFDIYHLDLIAQFGLLLKVFFLLFANIVEMFCMTFVYDAAGSLETLPDLFTQLFCYRSYFAELVMQFLKAVKGTDDILFIAQFLCCFAECCLGLKILLEVIFTSFEIQL